MRRPYMFRLMFVIAFCGVLILCLHFYMYIFNPQRLSAPAMTFEQHNVLDFSTNGVSKTDNLISQQQVQSSPLRKSSLSLKDKIVHLDLKGMPSLVQYYELLFPFFKKIGVTGLLIEYEDMFPYHGRIQQISNKQAYTKAEILRIKKLAQDNQLKIIPLVQTFGHLEFVLKLEQFEHLREVPRYMQVVCPTNNDSNRVIFEIIDQVMELHPEVDYLHIGSDEVYHIGLCPLCQERMTKERIDESQLFLQHVKKIANYVNTKYKRVRPIMWDDEFRKLTEKEIRKSNIGSLVDIVVWNYHTDVENFLGSEMWDKYSRLFPNIWIGSAFKGADKPNSRVVNETLYLGNHYSWIRTMNSLSSSISFKGIFLTGWQRYDHFSVPCELLPSAIPSLTASLFYLNNQRFVSMDTVFTNTSDTLQCANFLNYCNFPGSDVHQLIIHFQFYYIAFNKIEEKNVNLGWGNEVNLDLGYSNPSHVESILQDINSLKADLDKMGDDLPKTMEPIYPKWSIDEWMYTYFHPLYNRVIQLQNKLVNISNKHVFPRRPLDYSQQQQNTI